MEALEFEVWRGGVRGLASHPDLGRHLLEIPCDLHVSSGTCSLSASSLRPAWFDSGYMFLRQFGGNYEIPATSTRRLASDPRSILRCLVLWCFSEMTSGKCLWILRSCSTVDTRIRVSPRGFYRISHILYGWMSSHTSFLRAPRFWQSLVRWLPCLRITGIFSWSGR